MLCKSPQLTPAALAARRAKIERTGDRQALCLYDWFHVNLINRFHPSNPWQWDYTKREAGRVWCFMTGRMLLPRMKGDGLRTGPEPCTTYRYADSLVCPTDLKITDNHGRGIQFWNPTPSRRKRVRDSWVPRVEFLDIPLRLPRARRVRGKGTGPDASPVAAELLKPVSDGETDMQTKLRFAVESGACLENPGAADLGLSASDLLPLPDPEDCEGMSTEELLDRIRWGMELLDSMNKRDDP